MCSQSPPLLPLLTTRRSPEANRSSCRSVYEINPSLSYEFKYERCHSESDGDDSKLQNFRRALAAKISETRLLINQTLLLRHHNEHIEYQISTCQDAAQTLKASVLNATVQNAVFYRAKPVPKQGGYKGGQSAKNRAPYFDDAQRGQWSVDRQKNTSASPNRRKVNKIRFQLTSEQNDV